MVPSHDLEYRRHRIPKTAACNLVPVLKNERDIRCATTNVLRLARNGLLTAKEFKLMLYGLQVARSTLPTRTRKPSRTPAGQ